MGNNLTCGNYDTHINSKIIVLWTFDSYRSRNDLASRLAAAKEPYKA
jgi:hypothetical protein